MEKMIWVLLFICLGSSVFGDPDVIGSPEPVKVAVGHDAILPCRLDPAFDVTTLAVEWRHHRTNVHSYGNRSDYLGDQDENFRGRTSLFHDEMTKGNISLKLTNVTELDAGSYTCCLSKLHCQRKRGNVTLTVDTEKLHNGTKKILIVTSLIGLCVVAVLLLIAVTRCCFGPLKLYQGIKREENLQMSDRNTTNGSGASEPFLQSVVVDSVSNSTIEQLTIRLHETEIIHQLQNNRSPHVYQLVQPMMVWKPWT